MQRIFQFMLKPGKYVKATRSKLLTTASHQQKKVCNNRGSATTTAATSILQQQTADLTTTATTPKSTSVKTATNRNQRPPPISEKDYREFFKKDQKYSNNTSSSNKRHRKIPKNLYRMDDNSADDFQKLESKLAGLRQWESTPAWDEFVKKPEGVPFTLLSYNILAQNLLEAHPYLYNAHDQRALSWQHRFNRIVQEILTINPEVLCLQEVQESHLNQMKDGLSRLDLSVLYKRRTGFKDDGCAILYNHKLFNLVEHHTVEYYQPGVQVSNSFLIGVPEFSLV